MLRFPNAKINLGLYITQQREDGYHDLETVFYPLNTMRDALEIVPAKSGEGKMQLSGLPVGGDLQDNLVRRAYALLQEQYQDRVPPLDIYLHKTIPMGAGLGGGSSDAAFALQMIADYCGLGLAGDALEKLTLTLGSDCPFFIRNTPQFATGRGEVMEPVAIDLSAYRVEVVCPEAHISTRAAFSRVVPRPAPFNLRELPRVPVAAWREILCNDFEESAFTLHPEIGAIKERMYAAGALYASMSGSGSAVYGVFGK